MTQPEFEELFASEYLDEEDAATRWERLLHTLGMGFSVLAGLSFRKPSRAYEPKDIIAPLRARKKQTRPQRQKSASVAAQKAMLGQVVAQQRGACYGTA